MSLYLETLNYKHQRSFKKKKKIVQIDLLISGSTEVSLQVIYKFINAPGVCQSAGIIDKEWS